MKEQYDVTVEQSSSKLSELEKEYEVLMRERSLSTLPWLPMYSSGAEVVHRIALLGLCIVAGVTQRSVPKLPMAPQPMPPQPVGYGEHSQVCPWERAPEAESVPASLYIMPEIPMWATS